MQNSSLQKLPEERLAVLLSGVLTGMCIVVLYRQNKSLFDSQIRELQQKWYKLEDWLAQRPWPKGKMWEEVQDAINRKDIDP